ncbi:MAG: MazG nucleotide pyrophosphohydrolase domain-containing protein [Bacillota bacterium]
MQTSKAIPLPRLNGISPTVESTALKLMEEAGELGAAISRLKRLPGIQPRAGATEADLVLDVARELLDVAQTAITMMFVLEEQYNLDIESVLAEHLDKLRRKGYLV